MFRAYKIIIFSLLSGILLSGCDENNEETAAVNEAAAYNDSIVEQQEKIIEKIVVLNTYLEDLDSAGIATAYSDLKQQTDQSIATISDMGAFKEDASLKNEAVNLFNFYQGIFNTEYDTIITLIYKGQEGITEEDLAFIDSVSTSIEEREAMQEKDFKAVHETFARKHNLILKKQQ